MNNWVYITSLIDHHEFLRVRPILLYFVIISSVNSIFLHRIYTTHVGLYKNFLVFGEIDRVHARKLAKQIAVISL